MLVLIGYHFFGILSIHHIPYAKHGEMRRTPGAHPGFPMTRPLDTLLYNGASRPRRSCDTEEYHLHRFRSTFIYIYIYTCRYVDGLRYSQRLLTYSSFLSISPHIYPYISTHLHFPEWFKLHSVTA